MFCGQIICIDKHIIFVHILLTSNLKVLRKKREITQRKLAEAIGVNLSAYGNYETGYSNPDYGTLYKLARFFGISVDDLLYTDLGVSTKISEEVGAHGHPSQTYEEGAEYQTMQHTLNRLATVLEKLNETLNKKQ